jgi:hypothetical protein
MLKVSINTTTPSKHRLLVKSDGKRASTFKPYTFEASLQYRIKFLHYTVWLTRKRFRSSDFSIIDIIADCLLHARTFHVIQVLPGVQMGLDVHDFIQQLIYRPFMPYFGYKGGFRIRRPSKEEINRLRELYEPPVANPR